MNKRMEQYNRILQEKPVYKKIAETMCDESEGQSDSENLYIKVFLPVLIEFVSWVLDNARKSGKKRLYFLARDGYQMYLVAQRLCKIKDISLECRYLEVSRYAMRTPEYHLLNDACVDYICVGGIDVTIERIMRRAGLSEQSAGKYLQDRDRNRILNYQELMQIKEKLRQNQEFLEAVQLESKKSYQPAIEYLKQEGLFDEVEYALVDSGWIGTLQKTIAHLVERKELEGYYFGMYETPTDVASSQYHTFYFGAKWGLNRKVSFSNCLFEAVFTSPKGMTLQYRFKGGKYVPITDFEENPNKELIEKNCGHLARYMDLYERYADELKDNVDSQFVEKLLKLAMGTPTELEVGAYGNLLFSDDVLEGNLKKVAADLTEEEIHQQRIINKLLIMLGAKKGEIHESAWIEGSIVKTGCHIRQNLYHAKLYKYFVYIRKMLK